MIWIVLSVYAVGIILAAIGFLKYRSNLKSNTANNIETTVENKGTPIRTGLDHLKIICK